MRDAPLLFCVHVFLRDAEGEGWAEPLNVGFSLNRREPVYFDYPTAEKLAAIVSQNPNVWIVRIEPKPYSYTY
jgi:hypothetical protein